MRRVSLALVGAAAIVAAVVGFTSMAHAAENERITGSSSFTDSSTCVDPIHVDGVYNEMMHTFYDTNGNATRIAFTGNVTITYTDLVNGHKYRPNTAGPGTVDLAAGQVILRGGNGAIFTDQGLLATDGRLVLDLDGNLISITGRQTGVCAALGTMPALH
jgi:hypothetical protein